MARGKLGIEENAIFSQPFGVGGASLRWLAPLYTATFEVMTRDGSGLADPEMLVKTIHTQPVLFIAAPVPDYMPARMCCWHLATAVGSRHQVAARGQFAEVNGGDGQDDLRFSDRGDGMEGAGGAWGEADSGLDAESGELRCGGVCPEGEDDVKHEATKSTKDHEEVFAGLGEWGEWGYILLGE